MKPRLSVLFCASSICACASATKPAPEAPPPSPASVRVAAPPPSPASVEVAITVDDLPSHGPLVPGVTRLDIAGSMLRTFAAHRVPTVHGFINGKKVEDDPTSEAVLRAWVAAGQPLANHSWSHPNLNATPLDAYLSDITNNEALLSKLEPSSRAWHFFRYPFLHEGDTLEKRAGVRKFLLDRGYAIAEVSIDGNDWAFNAPYARCTDRGDKSELTKLKDDFVSVHVDELRRMRALGKTLQEREVRHVLLLHAGVADADALEELLTAYEHEGVRWVDLPTALSDSFYSIDPGLPFAAGPAFPYLVANARGVKVPPPIYARGLEEHLASVCR